MEWEWVLVIVIKILVGYAGDDVNTRVNEDLDKDWVIVEKRDRDKN